MLNMDTQRNMLSFVVPVTLTMLNNYKHSENYAEFCCTGNSYNAEYRHSANIQNFVVPVTLTMLNINTQRNMLNFVVLLTLTMLIIDTLEYAEYCCTVNSYNAEYRHSENMLSIVVPVTLTFMLNIDTLRIC
jgi:hypothetical protein